MKNLILKLSNNMKNIRLSSSKDEKRYYYYIRNRNIIMC